ncbi:plasmid stabilization system protein ParE [Mucilaginibacter yixingensis]|uniref:Plasmid stabilization system protein ParE n=1 Tax=Mucilaginibacter yixingensis TaxID=1295612 RepID=A0A2T5J595_9SPHI|nr:type II toxin-antitoxin system RelE/ParE family toxin [Mucilaginibacter yixingensis]PTQ93150.1 plasmid stabilization system protein ParE [Mucilaginibacter yixingensis]
MARSIKWSPRAKKRYQQVLDYLQENWGDRVVQKFIERTDKVLYTIAAYPYAYEASSEKIIRKAVIGKQNSVIYRIDNTSIYLLTFWDNRQDPKKLKY